LFKFDDVAVPACEGFMCGVYAFCKRILLSLPDGIPAICGDWPRHLRHRRPRPGPTTIHHPESLRTWMTYLASDELEGRAPFSEGLGLAGAYIADQLKVAGVRPGGDRGTYFQRVEVLGIKSTNRSSVTIEVNGQKRTFNDGEGVTFPRNAGGKRTFTVNEVEFAGYGLNLSPAHNDYK